MPLRRAFRIPAHDINNVFKNGKRIKTNFFVLISIPNKKKFSRFSVVVPNNAASTIVKKNSIKRKIWHELSKNSSFVSGNDVVIKVVSTEEKFDDQAINDIKPTLLKIKNNANTE